MSQIIPMIMQSAASVNIGISILNGISSLVGVVWLPPPSLPSFIYIVSTTRQKYTRFNSVLNSKTATNMIYPGWPPVFAASKLASIMYTLDTKPTVGGTPIIEIAANVNPKQV